MIPFILASPAASSSSALYFKTSLLPGFRPISTRRQRKRLQQRKLRNGTCRAEFSTDVPIGVAIGACILNSLVFPITSPPEDDESDSVIDSADTRFAVMGIISFIPYFNWLSWLFAWLDTGQRRYAVYAIVYLAPYLRTNLSISPEDSWLPIASIVLCIIHIQLEASIKNGDIQGLQFFREAGKHISSVARKNNRISKEEEKLEDHMNLPSARDHYRNEIRNWRVPRNPPQDSESLNEDEQGNGESKH